MAYSDHRSTEETGFPPRGRARQTHDEMDIRVATHPRMHRSTYTSHAQVLPAADHSKPDR